MNKFHCPHGSWNGLYFGEMKKEAQKKVGGENNQVITEDSALQWTSDSSERSPSIPAVGRWHWQDTKRALWQALHGHRS